MLTIGTDAEFFLKQKGGFVSATRFLKGTKEEPEILKSGGNVHYDNVAFEFATSPAENEGSFVASVKKTLSEATSRLPKGVNLCQAAATNFPKEELEDEETRRFGCDPDYDAWKLNINTVPPNAPNLPFRSCGAHVHVGFVKGSGNDFLLDPYGKIDVVKTMDVIIGIPFTALDNSSGCVKRRQLYGKAGCHRPTSYGVEYRSLSNFWVYSIDTVKLVYRLSEDTLRLVREKKHSALIASIGENNVVKIINEGKKKEALKLWEGIISKNVSPKARKLFQVCLNKSPKDIYKEWDITCR